jgi:hypothetical protein
MTGFSIRRATPDEAAIFSAHRRAMFVEIAEPAAARLDALEAAFLPWVTQRLASEPYLGWLARDVEDVALLPAPVTPPGPFYAELGFVATNEMRWLLDKR